MCPANVRVGPTADAEFGPASLPSKYQPPAFKNVKSPIPMFVGLFTFIEIPTLAKMQPARDIDTQLVTSTPNIHKDDRQSWLKSFDSLSQATIRRPR